MQDLTDAFVAALSRRGAWDAAQVRTDVLPLITRDGGIFQWGQNSGEEWMRLLRAGSENYALIWTHAPLALTVPHISEALRHYLVVHEVVVVEASDWDEEVYSIDPAAVRAHGDPDFWHMNESDSFESAFSIMDLWWATV